jgi:hypothetical protein
MEWQTGILMNEPYISRCNGPNRTWFYEKNVFCLRADLRGADSHFHPQTQPESDGFLTKSGVTGEVALASLTNLPARHPSGSVLQQNASHSRFLVR